MKLVFERDIPAFQGKTWGERLALKREAQRLDGRIRRRSFFISVFWAPLLALLMVLRQHQVLPSLAWVLLLYVSLGLLLFWLAQALWITPLIKAALQNHRA